MARHGGFRRNHDGSKVVFFYGFPLGTDEQQFRNEILSPHPNVEVLKVDFFGKKLMAFVHCKDNEGAKQLISAWNKQHMSGSDKPLQVRFKTADRGNQNNYNSGYGGGNFGGGNSGMGVDPEDEKRQKIWNSIALQKTDKNLKILDLS